MTSRDDFLKRFLMMLKPFDDLHTIITAINDPQRWFDAIADYVPIYTRIKITEIPLSPSRLFAILRQQQRKQEQSA